MKNKLSTSVLTNAIVLHTGIQAQAYIQTDATENIIRPFCWWQKLIFYQRGSMKFSGVGAPYHPVATALTETLAKLSRQRRTRYKL